MGDPLAVYDMDPDAAAEALAWGLFRRRAEPGRSHHALSGSDLIRVWNGTQGDGKPKGRTLSPGELARMMGGG